MLRTSSLAALFAVALVMAGCGTPKGTDGGTPGVCSGQLPGDLVITEFLADPGGADEGLEYIEIFNASSKAIELDGVALRASRPDGTAEKKVTLTKGTIQPGEYYVLGDVRDAAAVPGYMNDTYGDGLGALSNTSGKIAVLCGTAVVDEITYTTTKDSAARILDGTIFPDSAANDDETRWCNATTQTGDFLGSPRAKNAGCQKTTCAGRNVGDLVITEFLANPAGTDTGNEYIEIYNTTGGTLDLEGITLSYSRLDGSAPKQALLGPAFVAAGKYFTLGDVQSPLPAHIDLGYGTALGALGNTDGILSITCGQTVVDEVRYTRAADGKSRVLDGNIAPPTASANDDEGAWCDAKTAFGSGFGSPRGANEPCGSTTAGCIDPVSNLLRQPVAPTAGKLIVTEVMADPKAATSGGPGTNGEWFELFAVDAMDLNGVRIHRTTASGTTSQVTLTSENCLAVAAGSYSVIARTLTPNTNGGIASPISTFNFSLVSTDTLYVTYNGTEIDRGTYPNATGTGVSAAFSSDRNNAFVNDSEYAWCDGAGAYGSGGEGTPGAANPVCPAAVGPNECRQGSTTDGGFARDIQRPDGGSVVITEVMASPHPPPNVSTDNPKEWVELTTVSPVDLNEIEVSNELGEKISIKQAACFNLLPGEYIVFGQSLDANQNGGIPTPKVIFPFLLGNAATTANPERSVTIRSLGAVVEKFAWTTSTTGAAMQLSSAAPLTSAANDVLTNRCDAVTPYGDAGTPDLGTPGAVNTACP